MKIGDKAQYFVKRDGWLVTSLETVTIINIEKNCEFSPWCYVVIQDEYKRESIVPSYELDLV